MLVKTITYTDFNGNERTEPFYFNLTKTEFAEMELRHEGVWAEKMQRIIDAKDGATIIDEFKRIIFSAYGEKSEDGRYFRKSPEISAAFENSAAYDVFFMEIVTDGEKAAAFVNGLVPADLAQAVKGDADAQKARDEAEARSRAALQGHNAPAQPEAAVFVQEPELPSEPAPRFDPMTGQPLTGL